MLLLTPLFAKSKIRTPGIFILFCFACNLLFSPGLQAQDNRVELIVRDGKIVNYKNPTQPGNNDMPLTAANSSTSISQGSQPHISSITSTIILNLKTENADCGRSNGAVIASASGGTAPYSYTLVNTGTTYTLLPKK